MSLLVPLSYRHLPLRKTTPGQNTGVLCNGYVAACDCFGFKHMPVIGMWIQSVIKSVSVCNPAGYVSVCLAHICICKSLWFLRAFKHVFKAVKHFSTLVFTLGEKYIWVSEKTTYKLYILSYLLACQLFLPSPLQSRVIISCTFSRVQWGLDSATLHFLNVECYVLLQFQCRSQPWLKSVQG